MNNMTDDRRVNLDKLLLSYYIRYSRLYELCNEALANINGDIVDVYIDLYDMLKPIYKNNVYSDKKYVVVSSVINMAAHIRGYFWSRHRLRTRIYLVYGENISIQHKQFIPQFGSDSHIDMLNYTNSHAVISSQLRLITILCGYIYDVYYVYRTTDFSMFTFGNIMANPNIPAVVITKSKYAYQIPAMVDNAVIFRPKKHDGNDLSYVVYKQHIYRDYFSKISGNKTLERFDMVNPKLLSAVIAMTGMPDNGLNTVMNTSSAFKMLSEAIVNGKIMNDYNSDIGYLYNALDGISDYIDFNMFNLRFRAVDLITQYGIYNSTAESKDISWYINLSDPNAVREINNKYFIDNPLDLNNL